ncbi:hypothetical protein ACC754_40010, partial [Rhizobium johnstonii]
MEIEIYLLVRIEQPGSFGRQGPDAIMIGRPEFSLAPIGKGFVLVGELGRSALIRSILWSRISASAEMALPGIFQ